MFNWFRNRRRKSILKKPWPSTWDLFLENNVGHYKGLSTGEQNQLKAITRIIVAEKHWEAHGGLELSDEIKVTVAGTAALMLLGVEDFYFEHVTTIIMYPD